jgi:thiol-disulfide isomerase/thioredoxin
MGSHLQYVYRLARFRALIWCAVPTVLLLGMCTCRNRSDVTTVEIDCGDCKGKVIEILSFDLLEPKNLEVAKGRFDSSGRATLFFDMPDDRFLTIGVDSADYRPIYIFAGQKTNIQYVGKTMKVKGSNGRFYTYLAEFRIISDSLLALADQKRTGSHQLREGERPAFFRGIRLAVRHFEDLVKADKELVTAHKEILLFYMQSFSQWLIDSFRVMETEETYTHWRKTGNKANGYAPDFFKRLPVSPDRVNSRFYFYIDLINSELLHHLWKPVEFHLDETGSDYDDGAVGLQCAQVITNADFPEPLSEFMLAKNLYHCLRLSAVTPSATELFDQFMRRFPRSVFAPALRKQFAESKALSEGEPAKDFMGFTEDGKPFQFSALKGKVVYVDFWATWCGPCIEEFPHSKKLIERFKDNDGIVFLFVSFDKDVEKWKGFLARKDRLNGLHVIIDRNEPSVADFYRITGIPHYLLIDDQGKIKSANAMRPSIPETADLLDELLALRVRRSN